jgi:hypothetical protein
MAMAVQERRREQRVPRKYREATDAPKVDQLVEKTVKEERIRWSIARSTKKEGGANSVGALYENSLQTSFLDSESGMLPHRSIERSP